MKYRNAFAFLLCMALLFSSQGTMALAANMGIGKIPGGGYSGAAGRSISVGTATDSEAATSSEAERLLDEELLMADAGTKAIETVIDGVTYRFRLNSEDLTATLIDEMDVPDSVTELVIPESVTNDGEEGDGQTYSVTDMELSRKSYPGVTSLIFPDSLEKITFAYFKFPDVTEITIPGTVKNFEGNFDNCTSLERLIFAEGVESVACIGYDKAISAIVKDTCTALTEIRFPETLKLLAGYFTAPALETVTLPDNDTCEINTYNLFSGCSLLASVELPACVWKIGNNMFEGCSSLTTVTSKGEITSIGKNAFSGCGLLETIPDLSKVTEMGEAAFDECSGLEGKEVDLSSLNIIPANAFNASHVTVARLSENLESVGTAGFNTCTVKANSEDGTALTFPDTLTSIGNQGFLKGILPEKVVIPDSVTSIGQMAFVGVTGVKEVFIGSGLTEIQSMLFYSSSVEKITFDNSEDNIIFKGSNHFPADAEIIYLQESINGVGDTVSAGGMPIHDAVDAADTVFLEKHVELSEPLVIPAGREITITSAPGTDKPFTIIGEKSKNPEDLIRVEEGAGVTFENINLSGQRLKKGASVLEIAGSVSLGEGASVINGVINDNSMGVIDVKGANASFTLNGGVVEKTKTTAASAHRSAAVKVSQGAFLDIKDGSIRDNACTASEESTSGILLYGDSSGTMSGGSISGNAGCRGSAVLLIGNGTDGSAEFTMTDGEISGNTCRRASAGLEASGAVHVESNASFVMDGGEISGNRGEQGGGVCVVDGNLQQNKEEYRTEFIMNGGEISGNTAGNGGGIYSYTNGVRLLGGTISDNTAGSKGGGVYSEGNTEMAYSELYMENVCITGNKAEQGGGLWLCPTGVAEVYVTNGGIIYNNSTKSPEQGEGAGDDVVSGKFMNPEQTLTLADRVLGGGRVLWYADGSVTVAGPNAYPSVDDDVPRYDGAGEPQSVKQYNKNIALKSVVGADGAGLAESKAKLMITGNSAVYGGGVAANGGIVIGEDSELMSIPVEKKWEHGSNPSGQQPVSVEVKLYTESGALLETMKLTAENGWKGVFEDLPRGEYRVEETSVSNYNGTVNGSSDSGFTITNRYDETVGPLGHLEVSKTVAKGSRTKEFTFTVTLSGEKAISGTYGEMTFENNTAVFKLSDGQKKTAEGLPAGIHYQVTESGHSGYSVTMEGETGEIVADETAKAHFINRRRGDGGHEDPPDDPKKPHDPKDPKDPHEPGEPGIPKTPGDPGTPTVITPEHPMMPGALPKTGQPRNGAWLLVGAGIVCMGLFTADRKRRAAKAAGRRRR